MLVLIIQDHGRHHRRVKGSAAVQCGWEAGWVGKVHPIVLVLIIRVILTNINRINMITIMVNMVSVMVIMVVTTPQQRHTHPHHRSSGAPRHLHVVTSPVRDTRDRLEPGRRLPAGRRRPLLRHGLSGPRVRSS